LKFGVFALPTYFAETDGSIDQFYQHVLALMEDAERLGFHSGWCNEHHFHPYGGMIPAPPVLLAALAARTSRLRLGTSVALLPLHHPLHSAEAYAMLDQISGGRLELGIGRGFMRYDYETYGVPWEEGQARVLETLDVILKAWQQQPFSHQGRFFAFDDVSVWPPPLQQPHPPIWGAATRTPESFAWFGTQGYNLMTVVYIKPLDELAGMIRLYREAAAAAGHEVTALEVSTHFQVYCSEDAAEARREAEMAVRRYIAQSNDARAQAVNAVIFRAEDYPYEQMVDEARLCVGTPDECAAILERARDVLGLTGVDCTFYFGGLDYTRARRSFELFAREVMPRFRVQPAPARTVA